MSEAAADATTTGAEGLDPALAARRLIRLSREATLATVTASGQPFASLVTPAPAPDLSVLLWLSMLSGHTRHLMNDPRCSLLFVGPARGPNPQKRARLTVTGLASRVEGPEAGTLKARWLARHPYARLYAGFNDFALWRITLEEGLWVGGFAMARRVAGSALRPDPAAVAAIAAAEAEIVAHVNEDHADALDAIAQGVLRRKGGGWRLAAVDVDGCDLVRGRARARLDFAHPVADAEGVRRELILAAKAGRERLAGAHTGMARTSGRD
ncbi:MAG: pyridoxamine 5'-phosphate oxidase family protein [Elioraea sp.]|nr:pyridoxamine 5'-phosphate oxidase family protein [Elioraea sp.]